MLLLGTFFPMPLLILTAPLPRRLESAKEVLDFPTKGSGVMRTARQFTIRRSFQELFWRDLNGLPRAELAYLAITEPAVPGRGWWIRGSRD
jgi:hypothetical protein